MSAWEQWGGKKPTTSGLQGAQDALNSVELSARNDVADVTWPLWRKDSSAPSLVTSTMSWNTRFKYFVGMAMLSMLFFGMASIFLPLIMIRPSKFALSFTLGSMCCMGAFAMLKGPAAYVSGLLHLSRLPLTSAYFVTLGCTLYSCLILGNYVFVVLSSVMQLMTLGSFALSAFPGGNISLKAFGTLFWKSARGMIQMLARLFR
ncbi:unnamed protein product [Peronospora belbahrii]|uniref:Vesicle transport protein n=1 Tax=Peronospora belbahrii TaxID=622444 RepID=A0ABN8CQH7_9STRA|nr:unnamed protein product [Peronospora belbahrii]